MMFFWILISLLVPFLKAQAESPMVIYAQIGGTATLPRYESLTADSVYVNWFRGSDINPIISRNPQSTNQKGKDDKTQVSLLPDYSLKISPVQDSDFVIWRCVQHALTASHTKTYKLYHVTIPKVPVMLSGGSLSLECNLEPSSEKPRITWISPKHPDCNQIYLYKKTISVKAVSRCHIGVWTCKVEYNNNMEAQATTTVSVIDLSPSPPDPIYTSVPLSSEEPAKVNIPCSLFSNIPWSVLNETGLQGGSWSFTPLSDQNQQQALLSLSVGSKVRWNVTQGSRLADKDSGFKERELKDHDLSITLPASEKIRGEYTCNLKFNSKTLSSKVKVEVLQVISSSGKSPVYEGHRVNLTCTLGHPNMPDLNVKWKHRSCSRCTDHVSPVLSIPEVKMEQSGKWTCELWKNETLLTSAVLLLKIEKAPVDIWLCVAIVSGVMVFILLLVVAIIGIRRHKQMMMYRRRKTRFCCCKNPQPKGFYKT